jgi:hypothetical protein
MTTVKTTSKSSFAIVRKISELLKLGNDGKLDSFVTRVVKTLNKEILIHNKNLATLKFNNEQELDELNDKLEDANASLTESYTNIKVNQVDTNEKQTRYVDIYLQNIDNHLLVVKQIEEKITRTTERFEKESKSIQEQVDSLNKRIKIISAK